MDSELTVGICTSLYLKPGRSAAVHLIYVVTSHHATYSIVPFQFHEGRAVSHFSIFCLAEMPVPEFIDPRFRENKPKTLVFSHRKRAFWACCRENCL
jgi:hypothetical protein